MERGNALYGSMNKIHEEEVQKILNKLVGGHTETTLLNIVQEHKWPIVIILSPFGPDDFNLSLSKAKVAFKNICGERRD